MMRWDFLSLPQIQGMQKNTYESKHLHLLLTFNKNLLFLLKNILENAQNRNLPSKPQVSLCVCLPSNLPPKLAISSENSKSACLKCRIVSKSKKVLGFPQDLPK